MDRYVLSALVQNHAGVLSRVSGLFSRRGYNIDSLTVGETQEPGVSRMTIVVRGDEATIEQIEKQLEKLVEVGAVRRLDPSKSVYRELALIKVAASHGSRPDIVQIAGIFRARIVDVAADSLTIEVTGDQEKIDGLIELLAPYGISRARQDRHRRARARTLLVISYLAAFAALKGDGGGEQTTANYPPSAVAGPLSARRERS